MLIRRAILERIRDGSLRLAFRRWRRPTVRAGGRLLTAVGQLAIDAVERVDARGLGEADAAAAGYASLAELRAELATRREGDCYRIRLRYLGEDPRRALRERDRLEPDELDTLRLRLERLDARARRGPWTRRVLQLLARRPGVRAADLAATLGVDTARFKTDVRELKALGLTESLEVGYRLSPRGRRALDALRSRRA